MSNSELVNKSPLHTLYYVLSYNLQKLSTTRAPFLPPSLQFNLSNRHSPSDIKIIMAIQIITIFSLQACATSYTLSSFPSHRQISLRRKAVTPNVYVSPRQISLRKATTPNLSPKDEQDALIRSQRGKRAASAGDRVVELKQPLGLVLDEDSLGNVFVETVAPLGNAARSGIVKKGDTITMCSATFGDQLWSTRGVGLARVLSAIKVRRKSVTLVFENSNERRGIFDNSSKASKAQEDARAKAQQKKDALLNELQEDEKQLKKGFFGLW